MPSKLPWERRYERKCRMVNEDTPALNLTPGDSYFEQRQAKPVSELLGMIESQYAEMGKFLTGLSEEQLNRKAHIPFLKETPLTEYPTLTQWTGAIINFHLAEHVSQLQNLCK